MKYYAIVTDDGRPISSNEGYPFVEPFGTSVIDMVVKHRMFRPLYLSVKDVKHEIVSAQKMFPEKIYNITFAYVEINIEVGDTVWTVEPQEMDSIMLDSILSKLDHRDAAFIREQMSK